MRLPGGGHESCPVAVMRSARHEFVYARPSRGWGPCQGRVARGEFHPRAPTERSVTVSRHSALVILIISGYLTQAQWAKNRGYCVVTRSQAARAFRWARNR